MKNLSLREFQQKGKLSVGSNIVEPILLTGRTGPLFFLVPADASNLETQYRELLRAMGQVSLRTWQDQAEITGINKMSLEEINQEIYSSRAKKKSKAK